eukprot:697111_1
MLLHDNIIVDASANFIATTTAEYESLHCPQSNTRYKPPNVPKSKSVNLYLPHPNVKIIDDAPDFIASITTSTCADSYNLSKSPSFIIHIIHLMILLLILIMV